MSRLQRPYAHQISASPKPFVLGEKRAQLARRLKIPSLGGLRKSAFIV